MSAPKIVIGIDPGTKTGVAVKDLAAQEYILVMTKNIFKAVEIVNNLIAEYGKENVYLVFEDARKRKWFGAACKEKLQGAGSIKRDCAIWEEFCEENIVYWRAEPPKKGKTKLDKDFFKRVTNWKGRTSGHARDAAMLIVGYNINNLSLFFPKE